MDQTNGGMTEIEQTGKNLNKAREAYSNFIQSQKLAQTKHTIKKQTMRED